MGNNSLGRISLYATQDRSGGKPHIKGFVELDSGEKFEVALWPAKNGKPGSYSGSVSTPRERQQQEPAQRSLYGKATAQRPQRQDPEQPPKYQINDLDDEIPF